MRTAEVRKTGTGGARKSPTFRAMRGLGTWVDEVLAAVAGAAYLTLGAGGRPKPISLGRLTTIC